MCEYNSENLTKTQLWVLAMSATLTRQNSESHNTLYGCKKSEENIQVYKHLLQRDWNINNRHDLLYCLNWLPDDGHEVSFSKARHFLSPLSETAQNAFLKSLSKDSNKYSLYHLAKIYDKKLPASGILAWDYGRYVFLCRHGALLDYISDKEAWAYMFSIASSAQKAYSSWREFGLAYIVGRHRWLGDLTKEATKEQIDKVNYLMFNEESPWNRLDWNMKLDLQL